MRYLAGVLSALTAYSITSTAPAEAVSQSTLSGWKAVSFGESEPAVISKLKKHFKYETQVDANSHLLLGEFAGYRHVRVFPNFTTRSLTTIRFAIASQDGLNTLDIYYDLVGKAKSVYGQHTGALFDYYEGVSIPDIPESETVEETISRNNRDVLAGRGYFITDWVFPKDGNHIRIQTVRLSPAEGSQLFVAMDYVGSAVIKKLNKEAANDL